MVRSVDMFSFYESILRRRYANNSKMWFGESLKQSHNHTRIRLNQSQSDWHLSHDRVWLFLSSKLGLWLVIGAVTIGWGGASTTTCQETFCFPYPELFFCWTTSQFGRWDPNSAWSIEFSVTHQNSVERLVWLCQPFPTLPQPSCHEC